MDTTISDPVEALHQPSASDKVKAKLNHSLESAKDSASSCCQSISNGSSQLCNCTTDAIRNNPYASVVGAAVFGAAVCYLILEGRRVVPFSQRYIAEPLSGTGETLRSAIDNVKFW